MTWFHLRFRDMAAFISRSSHTTPSPTPSLSSSSSSSPEPSYPMPLPDLPLPLARPPSPTAHQPLDRKRPATPLFTPIMSLPHPHSAPPLPLRSTSPPPPFTPGHWLGFLHPLLHMRPDHDRDNTLFLDSPPPHPPRHLVVMVHGYTGTPDDLRYVRKVMEDDAQSAHRGVLVHVTDVNTGRTQDGVAAGGKRVAQDVRALVAAQPTLERLSVIGFSLGGLYARYAVADLFDPDRKTVAGLRPDVIMTVATPHLGVREFGYYRFAPKSIHWVAQYVAGQTGMEMMLHDDDDPVLLRMAGGGKRAGSDDLPFLSALAAFDRRVLYANCQHDFMVPYGSAAMDNSRKRIFDGSFAPPDNASIIDDQHDQWGCRVWYEVDHFGSPAEDRAGVEEDFIAERLGALGWRLVGVDFDVPVPVAHNRIVAMMRNPVEEWINRPGRRAVSHMISTLLDEKA